MTKAELVDHVAATVQLSKSQTDAVLTQCLQAIMDALQAGESVELRGFGRFHLRQVAYPLAADNVSRPLVSRLKGLHQPVVRSRIRFSAPHSRLLACL